MLSNIIKIIYRHLRKQRIFLFINVLGLSIGVFICAVIYMYVKEELSVDSFFSTPNTYRVLRIGEINNEKYLIGVTSGPYAPALQEDFPQDIIETTRLIPERGLVTYGEKSFFENNLALADSNFFEIFQYPFWKGSPETSLDLPNSIVLTKESATKYFGDEDPMDKVLVVDRELEFVVTGVLNDLPASTHQQFDMVANSSVLVNDPDFTEWWNNGLNTYVVLDESTDLHALQSQLPAFMDKYFGADFQQMGRRIDLKLQPLDDVYFEKDVRYEFGVVHGNIDVIYIFIAIGIFILIIAIINFVNLATAQSVLRSKEVGIRKTLGSSRRLLVFQFLWESFFIVILSTVVGLTLAELFTPYFNSLFGLELSMSLDSFSLIFLILVVAGTGLLAGFYPALVLSSYRPVSVLKGKRSGGAAGERLRKLLVVFQFAISTILIIATLVVGQQLQYIHDKDVGFDREQVLLVRLNNSEIRRNSRVFKERLLQTPGVVNVTSASGEPGGFHDTMHIESKEDPEDNLRARTLFTDYDYVETFGLDLITGRDFSPEYSTDTISSVVINETLVRDMGWTPEEAIGKEVRITWFDTYGEIVGVVEDYNFQSLKTVIEPLIILPVRWSRLFAVKIETGDMRNTVAAMEDIWKGLTPGYPFDYEFMDDRYANLYRTESTQSRLFIIFSVLSILIACLGIIGLAIFSANQRTKEIGIRKVLGASVERISLLLAGDFLKLVLISNLLAWPLAWWAMSRWLENFAYKTSLPVAVFLLASVIAVLIALFAISANTIRAATSNPVDSIREE